MPQRLLREVEGDEMGDFYQFDNLGQVLEGTLVKERTTKGQYGEQLVYDVKTDEGRLWTVTATWDLKSKLAKVPKGSYVRIEYVNNKDLPPNRDGTAKQPMKVFRVQTDAQHDAPAAPKKAPDEDSIPF
jgi:hypothetical protein